MSSSGLTRGSLIVGILKFVIASEAKQSLGILDFILGILDFILGILEFLTMLLYIHLY